MSDRQYELGSAELEVLKVLWDAGPSTVRQVMNHLHGHDRHLAYTTVLTVLTRLEQKGFVLSDKAGLAYVYDAAVSREEVTGSRLRSLVDQLFDGAAGSLVVQLIRTERFTPQEIEELQKLIEELDSSQTRSSPS